MDTRKCGKCHIVKPLTDFYHNRKMPLGRHYECKKCSDGRRNPKEYYRKHRIRIGVKLKENRLRWRENFELGYWKLLGKQHKVSGQVLMNMFIEQDKKCFYCHVPLSDVVINVDHVVPRQLDKVVLACAECNRLKWDRTGEQFAVFLKEYIQRFK